MYYVFGSEQDSTYPVGSIASIENFIGAKGDLEWPQAVVENLSPDLFRDEILEGKECIGGLRFAPKPLASGTSADYIILMGIATAQDDLEALFHRYSTLEKVQSALQTNKAHWLRNANKVVFASGLAGFSNWVSTISF